MIRSLFLSLPPTNSRVEEQSTNKPAGAWLPWIPLPL